MPRLVGLGQSAATTVPRLSGSRSTAPGPRSARSSPGLVSAQDFRLRQPQPMQLSSRSRSSSIRRIWSSSRGRQSLAEPVPVGLGRRTPVGQGRERLADLLQGQPDPLGGPDEGHPAQRGLGVAALVAGRALRGDQAAALVEADRRGGDARALGELADGQGGHTSTLLELAEELEQVLVCGRDRATDRRHHRSRLRHRLRHRRAVPRPRRHRLRARHPARPSRTA